MLLLKTEKLPQGENWLYELKIDGCRSVAFKTGGTVHLRSRNNKDFAAAYPGIVGALARLPDETVIDGEIAALDEVGRPSFNALQNLGSNNGPLVYYFFDVMAGRCRSKARAAVPSPAAAGRSECAETERSHQILFEVGR